MKKIFKRTLRIAECGRPGREGFTLLELIVSITILSLVTLLIGSGFRLAMDSWDKGEAETEWTQRLRVLSGLLSQQIKSAYPYKMEIDEEQVIVFKGDSGSIMFVTALADQALGGFKWIRYTHDEDTIYYKEGLLPDKKIMDKIKGNEEIVDRDIWEFEFAFFSNEDDEWKDSWEPGKKLPGAVRVKISGFQPFQISIPMGLNRAEENDVEES